MFVLRRKSKLEAKADADIGIGFKGKNEKHASPVQVLNLTSIAKEDNPNVQTPKASRNVICPACKHEFILPASAPKIIDSNLDIARFLSTLQKNVRNFA